jgi:hypothetical protein
MFKSEYATGPTSGIVDYAHKDSSGATISTTYVQKETNKSLVLDSEISKIHQSGTDNQIAETVPFTPFGTIGATNVQEAIEELAAECSTNIVSETPSGAVDGNNRFFTTSQQPISADACTVTVNGLVRKPILLVGNTMELGFAPVSGSTISVTYFTNINSISISATIQVADITLSQNSWTLVGDFYEYDLANTNITASKFVDVIPSNATISIVELAKLMPSTISSNGSVKLYCKNQPTGNIIITINIYE